MPVTVEQAHAIMQAVTVDVWNQESKKDRIKLLEKFCSPQMKAYAPDGSETTGCEEVSSLFPVDSNGQLTCETVRQQLRKATRRRQTRVDV